jgi:hypothetical protein
MPTLLPSLFADIIQDSEFEYVRACYLFSRKYHMRTPGKTAMSKAPGMTAVVAAINKPQPSASSSGYVRAGAFEGSESNRPVGLARLGDRVRGSDSKSDPKSVEGANVGRSVGESLIESGGESLTELGDDPS